MKTLPVSQRCRKCKKTEDKSCKAVTPVSNTSEAVSTYSGPMRCIVGQSKYRLMIGGVSRSVKMDCLNERVTLISIGRLHGGSFDAYCADARISACYFIGRCVVLNVTACG
jgi:hypothetical protein